MDSSEGAWNTRPTSAPSGKEGYFPWPLSDALHDLRTVVKLAMVESGVGVEGHHEMARAGSTWIRTA